MHTRAPASDFLATSAFAKRAMAKKLAKSWSLTPANSADVSPVDEEHVAMAEVGLSS